MRLDVQDTMSISFEDIDHSAGAAVPPPVAVMAMGQGANDKGILGNFTFLTNSPDYCIQQWMYQAEPFQWVALQEPGHVTGMTCEGAAGTIYYTLLDSEQNGDGSWHVITRRLTHNFTTADIEFLPEQDVADSPDFAAQYGNIVGCGHGPVTAPSTRRVGDHRVAPRPPGRTEPSARRVWWSRPMRPIRRRSAATSTATSSPTPSRSIGRAAGGTSTPRPR